MQNLIIIVLLSVLVLIPILFSFLSRKIIKDVKEKGFMMKPVFSNSKRIIPSFSKKTVGILIGTVCIVFAIYFLLTFL